MKKLNLLTLFSFIVFHNGKDIEKIIKYIKKNLIIKYLSKYKAVTAFSLKHESSDF